MTNNVDNAELDKFNRLASRWWDEQGESRPLHDLNPTRFRYVCTRMHCGDHKILDVGCGGGILSESLAKAGAQVTGIDLAEKALQVARLHALESELTINYQSISVETLADQQGESFDAITCMEMLEHVPDPQSIIKSCARLLKPGGKLFLSTLNRNAKSFALGIVAAEYILNLVPRGTHHYDKFIRPSELNHFLRNAGLILKDINGLQYNPFSHSVKEGVKPDINYLAYAIKPDQD